MVYDFTKAEIEFINENARFDERQQEVFNRLTDRKGRQSIVQMSMEMNLSTATISRIVKQVKKKIIKIV